MYEYVKGIVVSVIGVMLIITIIVVVTLGVARMAMVKTIVATAILVVNMVTVMTMFMNMIAGSLTTVVPLVLAVVTTFTSRSRSGSWNVSLR